MPRPGPRPYECVRRAWHSERHQPVRGLIIQQIFRFVHDNHSAATKKNKEWQEKLPVVVLRVEEIIYSKANSEAEYSNIETLWDRANDAVDTIIRKDETTESAELLPPCVEAALNLGCVAMRASRSQRYNNPRTYLRSSHQESNANVDERSSDKIPGNADLSHHIASSVNKYHSVYPLYYGTRFENDASHFCEAKKSDPVIIGVPVEGGCLHNLFPYHHDKNLAKETASKIDKGKGSDVGFDLSLRLGRFSELGSCGADNVGHGVSQNEGLAKEEFSFFPRESAYKSKWNAVTENKKELVSRTHLSGDTESNSTSNHFAGRMRKQGL